MTPLRQSLTALALIALMGAAQAQDQTHALPGPDVRLEDRPLQSDITEWAGENRSLVINLLTDPEIDALGYDLPVSVMSTGAAYANIPVSRMTGPEAADALTQILAQADGSVVINCGSATRASHLYAASLIRSGALNRTELSRIDADRDWNEDLLDRLIGETNSADTSQDTE